MKAIIAKDLVKTFEEVEAVKGINLEIEEGELFGLLGPNGAGKTTTISMLCTILKPTSGSARVWGYDVAQDPENVRKSIGIVFQDPSLDDNLTGRENLDFHARLFQVPKEDRSERINEMLDLVELKDKANTVVKKYSGGMKRRLEIARGLLHEPKVLFLDEPTLGLDPQTRRHIWDYIEKLNDESKITMILTTHYMDEADHLCDRIAIIDHGAIVAQESPTGLKHSIGGDVVTMKITPDNGKFIEKVEPLDFVRSVQNVDGSIRLSVDKGETAIPILMDLARQEGVQVPSVTLKEPTLEDVFIKYTGREIRPEEVSDLGHMKAMMRRH
jgi:ABC-2 type transport system ATP-binding protein